MKFGFRTGGFAGWKIEDVLKKLANIGFDGAELCLEALDMRPENFTSGRAAEIKKLMANLGIEAASVSYHGDNEPPAQRRSNLSRAVDIAGWLETDVLIINTERLSPGEEEKQWGDLAIRLSDLADYAEKNHINIAVEPEPLLVIGSTEDMMRMMDRVGSPSLKVNLDIGHAYITDPDITKSIKDLGNAIVHNHIEDIKDKVHSHLVPGYGDIDFHAMRKAFDDIGYNGYYVIDLFRLGDDPSGVAARSLESLRKVLHD